MPNNQLPPKETISNLRRFIVRKLPPSILRSMLINILNNEFYNCRPNDHASYRRISTQEEHEALEEFEKIWCNSKRRKEWEEFDKMRNNPKTRKLWEKFKKGRKF